MLPVSDSGPRSGVRSGGDGFARRGLGVLRIESGAAFGYYVAVADEGGKKNRAARTSSRREGGPALRGGGAHVRALVGRSVRFILTPRTSRRTLRARS